MATTSVSTTDTYKVKVWLEDLFLDTEKELFFEPYTGEGMGNAVQIIRKLDKGPGDEVSSTIIPRLAGGFTLGSSGISMEGHEQSITPYSYTKTLEEYKLAARWKEGLDLQRPIFEMPKECRSLLLANLAENIDQLQFDALVSGLTRIMAGDGTMQTTVANAAAACLTAAHKISPSLVRKLKVVAKTGGAVASASDGAPVRVFTPPRPIKINGRNHYILIVPEAVGYDLGENSQYHQDLKDAMVRSDNHPFFTGGIAMIDGVVIVPHENMPIRTDGGAGAVVYGKCVLMGAQALIKIYGSYRSKGKLTKDHTVLVGKTFGYDEEEGLCTKTVMRIGAPNFNNERYGAVGLFVTCSNPGAIGG